MKTLRWIARHFLAVGLLLTASSSAQAFWSPPGPELPNFDQRTGGADVGAATTQRPAVSSLRALLPEARIDFDEHTGTPKWIVAGRGFLSDRGAQGRGIGSDAARAIDASEEHRATKAFLKEHQALFGFGPEILTTARLKQDSVIAHNGLRTVVWEQELDGIAVFEGLLISHTTKNEELVNLSSRFLPDLTQAADSGTPNRAAKLALPPVTAARAVALAAQNLEETLDEADVTTVESQSTGPEQRQHFKAPPLNGDADAKLVWLPMNQSSLRLCWDIVLTSRARGEMFRVLIDAQTGEALVRHRLTEYLSDASFRVFTSDSPSPFSPGHSTPSTTQPPVVARTLVTWTALDTNASPAGWINDGGNETWGNNVDAHTDRDANNVADLPRPQGSPFRTFDFTLDLAQAPSTYTNAATTDLFYWCNWMHDKLYALGFTEAGRNFQSNNFARGGLGNDALQADAQDGSGFDNANMSTPSDGSAPRMQMFLFSGPTPDRDGDLDHEIVLHEYTHGLSNRRVGGGVGLSALQSRGMGEGWSDWYALALLSEPGDNVNGAYAAGGYATYQLSGLLTNYYYGIRRYPYSTDMTKNPLTFKDIDPAQATLHPGIPRSPIIGTTADEVHNSGEVWCVALWEARAELIAKYGHATGNDLILRLVTDGMNLSPANPNFLQSRDAILQADVVYNGGADLVELWRAFAKRGMGFSASSPSSSTTVGLVEAFDVPDDLSVTPAAGLASSGQTGGPFSPNPVSFTLVNSGATNLNWSLASTSIWYSVSPTSGSLAPGGPSANVTVTILPAANSLPPGSHASSIRFTNLTTGAIQARAVTLNVVGSGMADDFDPGIDLSQWSAFGGTVGSTILATNFGSFVSSPNSLWFGDGGSRFATTIPINTSGGGGMAFAIRIASGSSWPWETADLPGEGITLESSTNNGVTWDVLNNYTTSTYQTWTTVTSTIPVIARSPATLFRWRQSSHSGSSFDHWALDNVVIDATPATILTLTLPATASEGDLPAGGSVATSPAPTNDLTVTLNSLDTSEVTVPATVTILAGQSNAAFDLTIVDDAELDGSQSAQVTATATGYSSDSAATTIFDNETATLALSLPASVTEGSAPVQGTVSASAAPTASISVSLASSDTTEIQVPVSVLLPAGQTSAVFNVTVVNDNQIDGDQPVIITALVTNWTSGVAGIVVHDNEPTNLVVTLPASAREGNGVLVGAGTVRLGGTLPTNLIVSLLSSDLTELSVPPTATILAGQIVAPFDLTIVDDPDIDSSQPVTVTASVAGFSDGSTNMIVTDDESPLEPFNPSPAHLATNVIQTSDLAWSSGAVPGEVITNDVYFGTNPTPGPAELLGTTTNTSWPLPTLAPQTTFYWQVVARKAGITPGPVWQFTTRGVDHFTWDTIPSTQYVSQPFPVTITAKDAFETTVSNFTAAVELRGLLNGTTTTALFRDDFEDGSISDWTVGSNTGTRTVVNDTAAGGSRSFTLIGGGNHYEGIWQALPNLMPDRVNFYVRASANNLAGGYVVLADASNGAGTTTGNTAVFFYMTSTGMGIYDQSSGGPRSVPFVANQWYKISLAFNWPTRRVDFYVDDALAYTNIPFRGTVNSLRILHLYNFDSVQAWWDEIELVNGSAAGTLALTPTNSGSFSNGTWTGSVTALQPTTNVVLQADDRSGHTGMSSPFVVALQNDIGVSVTDSPDPVSTGANVTYSITVTNIGPASANNVIVTNALPLPAALVSVTTSQGSATTNGNLVICALNTLGGNSFATVTIVAALTNAGTFSNQTFVARSETDSYPANNTAVTLTTVQNPAITIADKSVGEGNAGATTAAFTVSVSPTPAVTTFVNFATVSSTAVAPGDFTGTNGTLTFAPGETNQSVVVTINGDPLYEANEIFYVNLSGATNATIADSQASGTILNDDPIPTLSIGDVTLNEGHSGTTNAVFPVALSTASGLATTFSYATVGSSATSGTDFVATSGSLSLPAGVTTTNIAVAVNGDTAIETDEVFYLDLSGPANAILLKREGYGLILNDDGLPGDLDHFTWSAIASPQYVGLPFGVTINAWDAFNNPAVNFNGPAMLRTVGGPGSTNLLGTNTTTSSFPIYTGAYAERTQVIYPAAEVGGAGRISALAIDVASLPVIGLSNWTIRIKPTAMTNYTSYLWEGTNWTIVCQTNLSLTSTGWATFVFNTPFDYDGTNSLMVDFSFYNTTSYGAGSCRTTLRNTTRTMYYYTSSYGNPLTWNGSSAPYYTSSYTPNLRLVRAGESVIFQPATTGAFTNGAWNGDLTALAPATNLVLRAEDAFGHGGNSSPFNVALRDDIALQMTDAPDPVSLGGLVTYSLTITNVGPSSATGVVVTNQLPASANFVSVVSSQGSSLTNGNLVVCDLGTLPADSAATITLTALPTVPGSITNLATVTRAESDALQLNNSATAITSVAAPLISINSVSVAEGNSGITPAVFTVSVSPPPATNITVNFTTANGSAIAGSDYLATNGILNFAIGQTNQMLTVPVLGDTNSEPSETFSVVLSSPVNASLGVATGTATIGNDDTFGTVAVYFNGLFVDTSTGSNGEASNVVASLQSLTYPTTIFTNIAATAGLHRCLLFPEFEVGDLSVSLSATDRLALSNHVALGGVLVVHGDYTGNVARFLNQVFGLALVQGTGFESATATRTAQANGTDFVNGPASLTGNNATSALTTNSLPAGALSIYQTGTYSTVALIPRGAGAVVYLGWDWFNAAPIGTANNNWLTVLGIAAGLNFGPQPPAILVAPTNRTAAPGMTATFSVQAAGSAPLSYQWRKQAALLAGATANSLSLTNVQWSSAGNYDVVVTNLYGAVTSAVAVLTVSTTLPVVINFDDATGPCSFIDTVRLTNRYAALGVVFAGPGGLDGGAIIGECGAFGVNGHSAPNFLGFNPSSGLNGGGIPRGPETLVFSTPVSNFQLKIGSGVAGGAILLAYDTNNVLLVSNAVVMTPALQTMQAATSGISRVVISATSAYWVVDDISFFPVPPAPDNPALVFQSVELLGGLLKLTVGTADASPISPERASNVWVYASPDLTLPLANWTALTIAPVLTNGMLTLDGINTTNPPVRYFRAIEGPWTMQPLRLQAMPPNGDTFGFEAGNEDGSPLTPMRAARMHIYSTTNLALPFNAWEQLNATPALGNGVLRLNGLGLTNGPARFFRMVEVP